MEKLGVQMHRHLRPVRLLPTTSLRCRMSGQYNMQKVASSMQKILDWLIGSSWFKKYSAMIGGFVLGMYVQATYWKQIRGTLDIWGVARDEWLQFLLVIAGAAGILTSIGLTMAKNKKLQTKAP